tara:strand:+ start:276 stop:1130 length:855 start_codon:yes stop_codon:yes gene_type:complete
MSNLPATLQNMSKEQIAVVLGVKQDTKATLPTLRLNYQKSRDINGEKVKLPKGVWTIFNGHEDVYGKNLKTNILMSGYQVREYDAVKEEYAAETIFFKTGWEERCEDTAGGYRCGKIKSKFLEGLSEEELAAQRNKKFYRVLWGLATLKGKNANGEDAEAVNTPFILRIRGQGFMPICNYLDSFKEGEASFDYVTEWDIEEGEHETTDFWIPLAKRGKRTKGLDDPIIDETLPMLYKWRDDFNDDVLAQYDKKNGIVTLNNAQTTDVVHAAIESVVAVDDEVPF